METALAKPIDIDKDISKSAGPGFTGQIRIVHSTSDALKQGTAQYKDYTMGNSNLGPQFMAVIGPHRYHALRLVNNQVDIEDYNLTKESIYNADTNKWDFPFNGTPLFYTPDFLAVKNRVIPDNNSKGVANLFGIDVLLYLPQLNDFGIFFIAKTAWTMTDTKDKIKTLFGQLTSWTTQELKSTKFSWPGPKVMKSLDPNPGFPKTEEAAEVLAKFLSPGKVYAPEATEGARPR